MERKKASLVAVPSGHALLWYPRITIAIKPETADRVKLTASGIG